MVEERPDGSELQTLAEMTVEAVLTRWPQTATVFQSYKTACVGCPINSFCTITEVTQIYSIPAQRFLIELRHAICEAEEDAPS